MKALKCLLKTLFALCLLVLILGGAFIALLRTEKGQEWAYHTAVRSFEQLTDTELSIGNYSLSSPLTLSLENVVISRHEKPLLIIKDFSLHCAYTPLFQGKIIFSELVASDVDVFLYEEISSSSAEINSIPPLPIDFKLEHFDIQNLSFHSLKEWNPLLQDFLFRLQGALENHPSLNLSTAQLRLTAAYQPQDTSTIHEKTQYLDLPEEFQQILQESIPQISRSSLHIGLNIQNRALKFFDFSIDHPLFSLSGKNALSPDYQIELGNFKGEIENLSFLKETLQQNIDGKVIFQGEVQGVLNTLKWTLHLNSPEITIGQERFQHAALDLTSEFPSKIGAGALAFDYHGHPLKISSEWERNEKNIRLKQLEIDLLQVQVKGDLALSLPSFLIEGLLESNTGGLNEISYSLIPELHGEGELQIQFGISEDVNHHPIQDYHLSLIGRRLRLKDIEAEQIVLYVHTNPTQLLEGQIQFAVRHLKTPSIQIEELLGSTTLASLHTLEPFHIQGKGNWNEELQFALEGKWQYGQDTLHVQGEGLNGRFGPYFLQLPQPFSLEMSAERMKINELALLWGETRIQGEVEYTHEWNVALNGEGEIDPYLQFFFPEISPLTGHLKWNLTLNGQLDNPLLKGHIDLINGTFESFNTGALYHNIQAHLQGNGADMTLTYLSAQDNKNGQITATGLIHLDPKEHFPFELQVIPNRIYLLDSDYIDISASGKLLLRGNAKHSILTGELTVDQAHVHLEEALPTQIKHVDIKYINSIEASQFLSEEPITPLYAKGSQELVPIEFDIKVNAPQNVQIEGNHLKTNWKGALTITGNQDNLQLNGDLRIVQGEYNFNGRIFQLTQGNIHFAGPLEKKTTLYVVASKEIDRITAEIIVKGSISHPVISFRSNPPLPQREVLSYILFNRGLSDITSDQGEQLNQSFFSLNTHEQTKANNDFLSRLRNNIGIDRLDFTTSDNKDVQDFGLQVGKHITEDVLVTVNQGVSSLSPVISVEAKIRKNLKFSADAGVGADAPIRMTIKWKKDY